MARTHPVIGCYSMLVAALTAMISINNFVQER
jgi:hypothetical protein